MYLIHRTKSVQVNVSEAILIFFLFLCLTVMFDCAKAAEFDLDVFAWSNTDDPMFFETIHVKAGTTLSISAASDDEWRLWAVDHPYWPLNKTINANGYLGIEIDGLLIGSLVGKIGETGDLFFIGTEFHEEITQTGALYLACWDYPGMYDDNDDSIHVTISGIDDFHPADFDNDKDVDGADLAAYINDPTILELSEFVIAFGTFEKTDNTNLSDLAVSAGTLIPSFSPERTHYIVKVDNNTEEIFLIPELEDPLASLKINDTEATSGVPFPVSLETGGNFISIEVTSQDASMVKDYSIIAVKTGRATLSSLTLTSYDLNPDFFPDINVYNIYVEEGVNSVEITAEADDPASLITINGIEVASGSGLVFSIIEGNNEMEIEVIATDGSSKSYYVFVRKTGTVADTVYVVDEANAPDEFETLTDAVNLLNGSLASGQVGEIRIQTTAPMDVDALTITGDIFIIVEPGASNVISGPSGMPLVINALGGWNISGLNFANSPSYTINAARGLAILGSSFSGDTVINVNGSIGLDTRAGEVYSKGLEFNGGNVQGVINVNLAGNTDANLKIFGTSATGINLNASGFLEGDASLLVKSNLVPYLTIKAGLTGNAKAQITGQGGLSFSRLGFNMEGNALVSVENNVIGVLEANFMGLQGRIGFTKVFTARALLDINMNNTTYNGSNNTFTYFSTNVVYSNDLASIGFTEKGGYAFMNYEFKAQDAPTHAQITVGIDNMDFGGNLNLIVGGQAKVTMNNGTVFKAEAYLKFPGNTADLKIYDVEGKAKLSAFLPDSNVQFYLELERSNLDNGAIFDTPPNIIRGKFDTITTVNGGIIIGHGIGEISTPDRGDIQSLYTSSAIRALGDAELIFDNLNITSSDQPGLYIEGVDVPVTIKNSTINGGIWAISCADIDADVTIENNSNLTGGIRLDGDQDMVGAMIDRQYTVSNNTITQNNPGGCCLSSHAIRNITASNNSMTAGSGAHGIFLNGGKMLVNGGSIITCGPADGCTAIGVGPSAVGANAVLYADAVSPITGSVLPSLQGYVKLTNNIFSNALVVDLRENARLLNDPVSDNIGLDPDGDVLGSLIDWNNDDHNCPDYPTRCDEWDDEAGQCGCGDDGIDPPSEPGI